MAEEFLGKTMKLTFLERKQKVEFGEILEINDLGIVVIRDNYRKTGNPRSEVILRDDIISICEPTEGEKRKLSGKPKKAAAKPKTTKPVAQAPVEPEPEPASTEAVSSDLVNDDDFDDVDDLDFEND